MKKWLSGSIGGGIVIAILATALWENVFKTLSDWGLNLLVNITTLGMKSYQDGLYKEIAKGLHEDPSLQTMAFFFSFLLTFLVLILILYFFARKNKSKEEIRESKFYSISQTIFRNKIFVTLYLIFAFVFLALDLSRTIYINQAITYYNQLKTITLPYMSGNVQSESFDSNFAQMSSSGDYARITEELESIARANKEVLPMRPSMITSINYPSLW